MFTILALDQATKLTGWALITTEGVKKHGVIEVSDKDAPYIERLRVVHAYIKELLKKEKPSFVVFEATQYQNNFAAFGTLSMLQGIIMAELFNRQTGFYIVPATCWKSFCGIKGRKRAEQKINTMKFVADTYGIIATEDEADAIGIATWAIANIKGE